MLNIWRIEGYLATEDIAAWGFMPDGGQHNFGRKMFNTRGDYYIFHRQSLF
ncbi:hypothetical protein [Affinibrenneria salicis]|uniref:hypothetical protein n=1 Tax=Affinibrenneria salicis TaxID=2590031 RepID=UPI00168A7582|nr:hypothetical protein [Affinibrenneria salicis]